MHDFSVEFDRSKPVAIKSVSFSDAENLKLEYFTTENSLDSHLWVSAQNSTSRFRGYKEQDNVKSNYIRFSWEYTFEQFVFGGNLK